MSKLEPHEILQEKIQSKFDDLRDQMIRFEDTNTFEAWSDCVALLPQIADLVSCLKQEAMKYEGKYPIN